MALAVDQGWGGRDSAGKRDQLRDEVVEYLIAGARKRRIPTHESVDDVEALAVHLYSRLDELFNVESEDGSDEEVAHLCLRLFTTCRAGDLSFAQQFLQVCPTQPQDLSKCQGTERIEYATEEDAVLDKMQGAGISEDGDDAGSCEEDAEDGIQGAGARADPATKGKGGVPPPGAVAASVQAGGELPDTDCDGARRRPKPPPEEPIVDEDGFVSVVKGRRRGGPKC